MYSPLQPLSYRILSRLIEAHAREPDPWLRDDLLIARLTVAYAARGDVVCSPHVVASYMVLGLHPNRVWPAIQERRRRARNSRRVFGRDASAQKTAPTGGGTYSAVALA